MSGKAMEIFVYFSPSWERLAAVFQMIFTMSLYAAVVILLVTAVRFIMRKRFPAWFAYALWGIVLFRLVLPVGLLTSSFSVFNLEESIRYITGQAQREEMADKASVETMEAPVPAIDPGIDPVSPELGTTNVVMSVDEGVILSVSVTPSPELIAAWIWTTSLDKYQFILSVRHNL